MNLEHKIITENEKRGLIIRAKNDNYAFEILEDYYINKYKRYIFRKYYIKHNFANKDDILQAIRMGIWYVIKTYNPGAYSIDYNIDSTVFTYIERNVITLMKTINRQKHQVLNNSVSYYKSIYNNKKNESTELTLFDLFESDIDIETKYIIKEQFKEFKNTLSELELKVLALRIRGFKYEEIADRLKINFKTVDNALQRIKRKGAGYLL